MSLLNNKREYFLQLVNVRTKQAIDDDAGKFQVYTKNTPTRPSIYNSAGVLQTSEVALGAGGYISETMLNGQIHFWTAISVTAVDISVLTNGGRAYFLKTITPSQHRVDVDPEQREYMLTVAINDKGSVTTVKPLGFQLKKGMVLKDVIVHCTTAFGNATTASNTVDFGVSSDTDGFYNGLLLQTTGIKLLDNTPQVLMSTTGTFLSTKVGVLLKGSRAGGVTTQGFFFRRKYAPAASTNLTQKLVGARDATATSATGKGYAHYIYDLFPSGQTSIL